MRTVGTVSRGIRAPIIRPGDDLVKIVADSVMTAVENENIKLKDKDSEINSKFKMQNGGIRFADWTWK